MAEEDLIFGKNRHFFGGIEPSNMAVFSAALDSTTNKILITATLPSDTVVNNQTLCSIAGAVIRRKTTDYPTDEFDGDLVANITGSVSMTDTSASPTGTYYYAAFPYTTQGVYNRNHANRVVVNEPANMVAFKAKLVYSPTTQLATVQITADLPDEVAGAVIRRSATGYPVNETDGDAFQTITADGVYTDSNVSVGNTYYYSAFPYTSTGAYNRNTSNRTSVTVTRYEYLFGFDLNILDSNPDTRVTYPRDVDNAGFVPASMNYTTGVFSFGSWPNTPGDKFMPKPCMLTYAGVVDHYLNPNDYTKKTDDTASSVADTSFDGNAMIEWPKIYVKRWTEGNTYKFRCCNINMDDGYECWSNYDRNNNEIDYFYTPIYFGSIVSGKMRSISGQYNSVSTTADTEITYAKANGNDWYTEVLADRLLIQDLLVMMAKNTAGQNVYGFGVCTASSAIGQGTMDKKGMFWGSATIYSGVKVFGMENWWGNLWRRTAGWMLVNGTQKVKLTRGTKDGTTVSEYNTTGNGYKDVAGGTPTGSSGGYISGMKTEDYGRIPFQANGASTTFEADGLYFTVTDTRYAFVGGNWTGGLSVGPFFTHLNYAPSYTTSHVGAALSCKPLAP